MPKKPIKSAYRYLHDRYVKNVFNNLFMNEYLTCINVGAGNKAEYDNYNIGWEEYVCVDIKPQDDAVKYFDITKPYRGKKYDVVLCFNVLEHVAETEKAIRTLKNLVRGNGIIIGSTPFMHKIHTAHDYWRFTEQGLKHIFKDCKVELFPIGNLYISALKSNNKNKWFLPMNIFAEKASKLVDYTDTENPTGYIWVVWG